MPKKSTLEVCRRDLFADRDTLEKKYDEQTVLRVIRLRDLYMYKLGSPESTDRKFVEEAMGRYGIGHTAAYNDLAIVKQLLPLLTSSTRAYHLWRANEMALDAFKMAKARKDAKAMVSAARQYAENNKVSVEDEHAIPYDDIVPQPFTATDDPTVLGIKPIPNIQEKIKAMIAKYRAETIDIEDVEAEIIDTEEDSLFAEDTADDEPAD